MGDTSIMEERIDQLPPQETTYRVEVTDIAALDHNRHRKLAEAVAADIDARLAEEDLPYDDELETVRTLLTSHEERRWDAIDEAMPEDALQDLHEQLDLVRGREERPYPSLMRLRFRPTDTDALGFVPGQHFSTRYIIDENDPDYAGTGDQDERRTKSNAYSVAGRHGDDIELLIKRIPPAAADSDSLTPLLFDQLEEGDELAVRGPYTDELILNNPSSRDAVFMATGTGIAPLKSMIDYTFEAGWDTHDGDDRDIWLFLGASWKDDLPYHDAFHGLAAHEDNFHYIPTCSREGRLTDWSGAEDYIQHELLKYVADDTADEAALPDHLRAYVSEDPPYDIDARIDPAETEFYLCGVSAMVESVTPVFDAIGVPDGNIQAEPYG